MAVYSAMVKIGTFVLWIVPYGKFIKERTFPCRSLYAVSNPQKTKASKARDFPLEANNRNLRAICLCITNSPASCNLAVFRSF
jgi:hypothetical protein